MSVLVGTCVCNSSQEAVRLSGSGGLLGSSSTSGYVGKASTRRAGRAEGRDPGARAAARSGNLTVNISARWRSLLVGASMLALGVFSCLSGSIEVQMRSIHISAAAEVRRSAQLASLQVALHVTKRQNGVNASDRVSVLVGTCVCNSSQEAVRLSGSGGLLYRWPRGFDTSVCPNVFV